MKLSEIPLKYKAISIIGVIVILMGGFALGYFSKRQDTVVKEKVVERKIEVSSVQQETEIKSLQQKLEQYQQLLKESEDYSKTLNKTKVVVIRPDGTKIEKTTENSSVNKSTDKVQDTKAVSKIDTEIDFKDKKVEIQYVDVIKYKERVVDNTLTPKYSLAVKAGYGLPALWRDTPNYIPGLPNGMYVGVEATRKLSKGWFIGGEITSRLDTGVKLGYMF